MRNSVSAAPFLSPLGDFCSPGEQIQSCVFFLRNVLSKHASWSVFCHSSFRWTSRFFVCPAEKRHPRRRVCLPHRRAELLGLWEDWHVERPEVKTHTRQFQLSPYKLFLFFLLSWMAGNTFLWANGLHFLPLTIFTFTLLCNLPLKVQRGKSLFSGFRWRGVAKWVFEYPNQLCTLNVCFKVLRVLENVSTSM